MALSDDKRNVFTTIGAYTSFVQQKKPPKSTNSYSSINNKKDTIPFLLDTLKVVAGTEALKVLTGQLLTKLIDDAEDKSKVALKKQFTQTNSNDNLPPDFVNNGVSVPLKSIDTNKKLKQNPNSDIGKLIYNNTKPNFDSAVYNSISLETPQTFSNMILEYQEQNDALLIKPVSTTTVGDFFIKFIDDTEIINKQEVINNVLDTLYGSSTAKQNKTKEDVYEQLQTLQLLDQALNDNDSFAILPENNNDLLKRAQELIDGVVYYDMGCGQLEAVLPFNTFSTTIQNISGSTDSFYIGNEIDATINSSTTGSTQTTAENKTTIRDGFFQKLIKIFTTQILFAVTTAPQVRVLTAILNSFQNNGNILITKSNEDMHKLRTFIMCMAKEIMRMVAEFIFNLVVAYLIKLLTPVIQKILKERITQYNKTIKSLTGSKKLTI